MEAVPVVDIAGYLDGSDPQRVAGEIEAAATEVGFFQIVGHGIDLSVVDAVYAASAALFALPDDEKEQLLSATGHPYRGVHLKRDDSGKVRQERFLATRYDNPAEAEANGVPAELSDFFDPNVWPEPVPQLRPAVRDLFVQSQALGGKMMGLFGLALGLGPGYFDPFIEPNASTFACNHYPARKGPLEVDPTVLFGEHFDGNTLTILHQRGSYEGLQVKRLGGVGDWLTVPIREDAFVINMGELMTRWTNDHWPSTRHRVVASSDPDAERTTLTTFHMPALQAVVAPLSEWVGADGPHYEPVTSYDWEKVRIKSYQAAPDESNLKGNAKVSEFARNL